MAKIVYRYNFIIVKIATGGFVVYNRDKEFNKGHAHLGSFNAAISAVKLAHRRQLPRNRSDHFIDSLIRLSCDKEYIARLEALDNYDYERMMQHGEIDVGKCQGR